MNTTKTLKLGGCAAAVFLSFASAYGQALSPVEIAARNAAYVPGEILIQFAPSVTDAQIRAAFHAGGLNLLRQIQTPVMKDRGEIGLTHVATSLPVNLAVGALQSLPGVEFAQPNWIYRNQAQADDPLYMDGSLWGMYGDDPAIGPPGTLNAFGSEAETVWNASITGSADVFVGVVESDGLESDHPDLAANIWTNPGEVTGNNIDDDGDGYPDDLHGWNSYADCGDVYETADAHGTHVAGTIGAVGGNGVGVAGVNWKVGLISGRFGVNGSGTVANAVEAIDYMTSLRTRKGLNLVALNGSFGTMAGAAFDQALWDSIGRAASAGILFVAAAMNANTNTDLQPVYPACFDTTAAAGYDSVISVAAIDSTGLKASFSNFGQNTVDLGAPGVSIYSTKLGGTYGTMSGTSMATPHVTGAIALYASTHPGATASQIKEDLFTFGVTPTDSLNGITSTGGRLNIASFISAPARDLLPPSAPTSVQATAVSAGRVNVTWSDASDNELGFAVERSTDGQTYIVAGTVGANISGYTDGTIRPNTTYWYRVRAYNPGGSSAFALVSIPLTTPNLNPPSAPANLTASALAKGGVALSWADKANNEDGFQIERQTGSGSWLLIATLRPNTVKYSDSSTTSRTTYSYRVRAFNSAWISSYSNVASVKSH